MTVLVTGGAGYIGSHMVLALAEAGESVVVIDNLSTGFSSALPDGVPLFIGDAGDESLVENVIAQHAVDSIIHFAGSVVVPESMRDPLAYYRNNTMTTRSLLNAAVKCGVNRFIFSSTAAVYGNPERMPVSEDAPTRPLSPYGSSKLMTEIMLHDVTTAHGMNYVVLRYFNVAGADPLARIGLSPASATVLHVLESNPDLSLGRLADALLVQRPNMTKLVNRLVAKKLVRREVGDGDRRQARLSLTGAGRGLHDELFPLVRQINQDLLRPLSAGEVARLDGQLDALQAQAERMVQAAELPKADRRRGQRAPRRLG